MIEFVENKLNYQIDSHREISIETIRICYIEILRKLIAEIKKDIKQIDSCVKASETEMSYNANRSTQKAVSANYSGKAGLQLQENIERYNFIVDHQPLEARQNYYRQKLDKIENVPMLQFEDNKIVRRII